MKDKLSYEELLSYYKGELHGKEKERIAIIIDNSEIYKAQLESLSKIKKEANIPPDEVIATAKRKFLNTFFPSILCAFIVVTMFFNTEKWILNIVNPNLNQLELSHPQVVQQSTFVIS